MCSSTSARLITEYRPGASSVVRSAQCASTPSRLQALGGRRPQVEALRLEPPLLGGEQQRSVPEADVEPAAVGDVPGDALHDARREVAVLLEGRARLLVRVGRGEDLRRGLVREVAVGEDMSAGGAAHPGHGRGDHRLVERVPRAVAGPQRGDLGGGAQRAGVVQQTRRVRRGDGRGRGCGRGCGYGRRRDGGGRGRWAGGHARKIQVIQVDTTVTRWAPPPPSRHRLRCLARR